MLPSKISISKSCRAGSRVALLAGFLFFLCQAPSNAQSGGDAFSSRGIEGFNSDAYYQRVTQDLGDDPFDTSEPDLDRTIPSVESLEPTGDPFTDSCLFGKNHKWYHRTYGDYPVFDDGTPWWQDYLDHAERFGCCEFDNTGKSLSKAAAIAVLLKENNMARTRQLRYTLRALYQLEMEPYERADKSGVDEHQCQRYRSLCLSASQQSPLPIMRAYYRARAFAYTDEQDQLWASLRRLKNLTRNHAAFADISNDLQRQERFDESNAVQKFEKN